MKHVALAVSVAVLAGLLGAYAAWGRGEYVTLRSPGPAEVEAPLAGLGTSEPADAQVAMTPQSYTPANVRVQRGGVVEFWNAGKGDQWPQAAQEELSARGVVPAGSAWRVAFPETGSFEFTDRVYPNLGSRVEVY